MKMVDVFIEALKSSEAFPDRYLVTLLANTFKVPEWEVQRKISSRAKWLIDEGVCSADECTKPATMNIHVYAGEPHVYVDKPDDTQPVCSLCATHYSTYCDTAIDIELAAKKELPDRELPVNFFTRTEQGLVSLQKGATSAITTKSNKFDAQEKGRADI